MQKSSRMIPKIMMSYAFTFMMIELADSASMVIDGLLVSRGLGPVSLAGIGLANPSFMIASLCSGVFAIGLQSSCSAAMGAGDRKKTEELFSGSCIVVAAIAAVVTVLGYALMHPLCLLFGADGSDPELYQALRDYLRGWFVGLPGFIGFTVLSPIVTLDGNKKCVTAATALQSILNIIGDILAMFVLKTGMFGVGFASGFGFDVAVILLILNFTRKRTSFHFRFSRLRFGMIKDIVRIGMPRLTKYGCKILSPLLINRTVMAIGGGAAMAAMSVKNSIANFCLIAGCGIAESVNLLSQVFYSEKDRKSLMNTARLALQADLAICSCFGLILYFAAGLLASIYMQRGTEEYGLTVTMLRCLALSLTLNGLNSSVLCYLQGTRKIIPAHVQTVSHRLAFLAISTFVLGKIFGINGLFAAVPVSEVLVFCFYLISARIIGRGKNRVNALLMLPDDFGYAPEDSLEFSITTMQEVIGISEQIGSFCKNHGIDRKRAYYAALCLEELAGNVVEHGFRKDNKKHSCDVRVMIDGNDVLLRIRDDCPYFNLKERYEAMNQEDLAANVGIRLVYGIAKSVDYVNLLNTNTLIIRV